MVYHPSRLELESGKDSHTPFEKQETKCSGKSAGIQTLEQRTMKTLQ